LSNDEITVKDDYGEEQQEKLKQPINDSGEKPEVPRQPPDENANQYGQNTKDTDRFVENGDGTVTDMQTGLMWQVEEEYNVSFDQAIQMAGDLTLGGYSDWRIPNMMELLSIVDESLNDPPFNISLGTSNSQYFWSSDIESDDKVWVLNAGGGSGDKNPDESLAVGGKKVYSLKAVRNSLEVMDARYTDNGDGTVADNFLGLMWQQIPSDSMNIAQAEDYSQTLSLGGYSDWRLPTKNELAMLCNYSYDDDVVNTEYFPSISDEMFWTGTRLAGGGDKRWFVDLSCGRTSYEDPSSELHVLCVRDLE
jgi:hypothetical protein